MKNSFFFLLAAFALASCQPKQITYENSCAELDAVDLEMLNVLEEIRQKYAHEPEFLSRLKAAQIDWIQYKDSQVHTLYPFKQKYYQDEYGMEYNYCKCAEWARLTNLRTQELRMWLDGPLVDGQEGCPNSVK